MPWCSKARLYSLCWSTTNGHWPAQSVQLSLVASRHCLASFFRQTNIKISWDLPRNLMVSLPASCQDKFPHLLGNVSFRKERLGMSPWLCLRMAQAVSQWLDLCGFFLHGLLQIGCGVWHGGATYETVSFYYIHQRNVQKNVKNYIITKRNTVKPVLLQYITQSDV